MDREAFFGAFRGAWDAPNLPLRMRGLPPLDSLTVDPADPMARAASDGLYGIIIDTPILRGLLRIQNLPRWQGVGMLLLFTYLKIEAVAAEIEARREAAEKAASAPEGPFSPASGAAAQASAAR